MICFYIKESSEKSRLKLVYKYLFNKLEIKNNTIELPTSEKQKLRNKKIKKFVEMIKGKNIRIVALSKVLEKQEQLKNEIYSEGIKILDGKYLFKILSFNFIEYICKKSKYEIQNIEISILVNDANSLNKSIILDLAEKVKTLNVITNNINDFKSIEDYLYDEKGIIIRISNNKKKSLTRSNIILNIDFCEEDINIYNIPDKSIIINTNNRIKIKTKKFNGININGYNIIIPDKYKLAGFSDEVVYESIIYYLDYNEARKQILHDKIKIKNLIGEKGVIQNQEFNKLTI